MVFYSCSPSGLRHRPMACKSSRRKRRGKKKKQRGNRHILCLGLSLEEVWFFPFLSFLEGLKRSTLPTPAVYQGETCYLWFSAINFQIFNQKPISKQKGKTRHPTHTPEERKIDVELSRKCGKDKNSSSDSLLGEGNGSPLQYSCLEKSHGQRSLAGSSSWGHKEMHMTEHTCQQQQTCYYVTQEKTPKALKETGLVHEPPRKEGFVFLNAEGFT